MAGLRTDELRPTRLDDFGGQPVVSRELRIILGAANERGDLGDHILLCGPPGLGKTTISHIIANELGVGLVATSGPAVTKPEDIIGVLARLDGPTVVFIDEIHRLPRVAEELLYSAMEDRRVDLIVGEGATARSIPLELPHFLLVGATTQAGMLSEPLRDRFGYIGRLRRYDDDALTAIVERSASILGVDITSDAARSVASRSRGTPRVANNWLRRVRDWAQTERVPVVDVADAEAALDAFGVDAAGIDQVGRDILAALCERFNGGPVGGKTLATSVGEALTTLEDVYEPHLMHLGFLARTPQGRIATPAAYRHLGLPTPAPTAAGPAPATLFDGAAGDDDLDGAVA